MPLPNDWREFVESLNLNGVEYAIVGAVALAYHGFPRYTGDLDILVGNSPENARRLEAALAGYSFGALLKAEHFLDSNRVVQLGVPPYRIDLLTSITGVAFGEIWEGRVEAEMDGIRANFISRESLHQKQASYGATARRGRSTGIGVRRVVSRLERAA